MTERELTVINNFWLAKSKELFKNEHSTKNLKHLLMCACHDIETLTIEINKLKQELNTNNFSVLGDK